MLRFQCPQELEFFSQGLRYGGLDLNLIHFFNKSTSWYHMALIHKNYFSALSKNKVRSRAKSHKNGLLSENSCLDVPDLFLLCCHYLNLFASYSSTVSNEKCFEKRNFLLRRSIKTHWRYMLYHWNIRATFPLIFPAVSMVFHLHLNSCIKLSSSDYNATRYRDFWAKRTGTSCT